MLSMQVRDKGRAPHPESAWAAVLARDVSQDGRFVYAVASTGIFCRPSCPSRRPQRRHVRFFPSVVAAEKAGYRACRRCHPGDPSASRVAEAVGKARAFLDDHLEERVTLQRLGRAVALSPFHLQRNFKRLTGVTPREYVTARRLERFKSRLKEGGSVTDAVYEAGYGSSSRLYEHSTVRLGMTPATYRRGGKGMRIRFAVVPSPLGRTLVAATERGVCAVMLGDSESYLEEELRREYPLAHLERTKGDSEGWTGAISRYLEGQAGTLELPLDVHATAFQWRVWRALQQIPPGSTRSYKDVAASLGRPKATRAVARACATNRVALVVPCHRVVRGDGGLGGYRWGVKRKRQLLDQERQAAGER